MDERCNKSKKSLKDGISPIWPQLYLILIQEVVVKLMLFWYK